MGWIKKLLKPAPPGFSDADASPLRDVGKLLPNQVSSVRDKLNDVRREGRVETFEEAIVRYGFTTEGLRARYRQYRWSIFLLLPFQLFSGHVFVSYLLLITGTGSTGIAAVENALGALGSLCILGAMLAKSANSSFRAWQIRNRRLGGLRVWASSPSQWWPRALPTDFTIHQPTTFYVPHLSSRSSAPAEDADSPGSRPESREAHDD